MRLASFEQSQGQTYGAVVHTEVIEIGNRFSERYPDLQAGDVIEVGIERRDEVRCPKAAS